MKKLNLSVVASGILGILTAFLVSAEPTKNSDEFKPSPFITEAKQITYFGPRAGEGYFSADGKNLIFQSERFDGNPFYQIYLMNLQNGKTEMISTGKGQTTCAWVHPTNKKVMFASSHLDPLLDSKVKAEIAQRKQPGQKYAWSYDEAYDIFEKDLASGRLKNLTKVKGYDAEGSYSPDGQWIAFASNREAYTGKMSEADRVIFEKDNSYMMDIYLMKADGSQLKQLTTHKGYDGGPFFSADGKKITWRRFTPDGRSAEIYTMNVDGSEQKQITKMNAMSWAPYFHPSGKYIIYTTNTHGYQNFELYLVDALGEKAPVRVTFEDGFDGLPTFSPDGNQLSWTKRNAKGESQIYLAKWDHVSALKALGLYTPEIVVGDFKPQIEKSDLQKVIRFLASKEMLGRSSGSEEEKIYTAKVAELLKAAGLRPLASLGSYEHRFEFLADATLTKNNWLLVNGKQSELNKDWSPVSFSASTLIQDAGVVFAGYGLLAPATEKFPEYNSYKGLDVKDKWVVVFRDIPQEVSGEFRFHLNFYSRVQHKVTVARNMGAKGVLLVSGPTSSYKQKLPNFKYDGSLSDSSLLVANISDELAAILFKGAGKDLKQVQQALDDGSFQSGFELGSSRVAAQIDIQPIKKQGINILAELKVPGASETVMVGGHLDHLGQGIRGSSLATAEMKDLTHYGADDNASGVAAILELAHYLANRPHGLKHNVIFAFWSAEELGNLGSKNFVKYLAEKKVNLPLKGYINLDMVGRLNQHLYVQGLGSSSGWKMLLEPLARNTDLTLVTQDDPYLPTDAMTFYVDAKVPVISLFTGSHRDYHTPLDTEEKINYLGLEKITYFVQDLLVKLPSSRTFLAYKQMQGNPGAQMAGRQFRVYLGTIPDYAQEGVKGVRISGTSQKSPAEKAGLQAKDVIIELAGQKIENLYDFTYALQVVKPNSETSIKVLRSGSTVELKITPAIKE